MVDKEKIETATGEVLAESGFEIVDLKVMRQSGKLLLQYFIDRENGGITLDDCGAMSDKIGSYIDMNNLVEGGYILEVSSPGMDRVLRKEKDFLKFKGSKVKIKLKRPVNNARVYYGELLGFENGEVILNDNTKFNLGDIEEARLNPGDDDILKKH